MTMRRVILLSALASLMMLAQGVLAAEIAVHEPPQGVAAAECPQGQLAPAPETRAQEPSATGSNGPDSPPPSASASDSPGRFMAMGRFSGAAEVNQVMVW